MFDLTRQERQVILFLVAVALTGTGLGLLKKINSPLKKIIFFNQDTLKVGLNSASQDLLVGVPGIGKKLAERIIEYRNNQVGFSSIEELKGIKGISESKYEKIKDYLAVK